MGEYRDDISPIEEFLLDELEATEGPEAAAEMYGKLITHENVEGDSVPWPVPVVQIRPWDELRDSERERIPNVHQGVAGHPGTVGPPGRPLEEMSVLEALKLGLVLRKDPRHLCPNFSPETHTPCRLEPGHDLAHWGFDGPYSSVSWA